MLRSQVNWSKKNSTFIHEKKLFFERRNMRSDVELLVH